MSSSTKGSLGHSVAFARAASRRLQHGRFGCQGGSWTTVSLAEKDAMRTEYLYKYAGRERISARSHDVAAAPPPALARESS